MNKKVTAVNFSPGKTTAQVAEICASVLAEQSDVIDLLRAKPLEERQFGPDDLVVFAMPVFSGRIPVPCIDMLKKLKGQNTAAIAIVVYGNREYDDALLELTDLIGENGFRTVGAGAFVARHSIFPNVAEGRPDDADQQAIRQFAQGCAEKLDSGSNGELTVKGNRPYCEIQPLPIKPKGDSKCNNCGSCSKICPMGAVDPQTPRKTDKEKCIDCTACIYVCPQHARAFRGFPFKIANKAFLKKFGARKEPEVFV